jgi:hypothetical protein
MLMILGGFYIPFDNIPFFVRWLNHFSFAKCGPDPPAPAPACMHKQKAGKRASI